jgi:hypothetical protein
LLCWTFDLDVTVVAVADVDSIGRAGAHEAEDAIIDGLHHLLRLNFLVLSLKVADIRLKNKGTRLFERKSLIEGGVGNRQ